jgi:hypothetical protein
MVMAAQQSNATENFDDLFVDQNLFAVFRAAPSVFATFFNGTVTILAFIALAAFCYHRFTERATVAAPAFVSTFSSWATVGWTLSSTLLGFLIAGFALLCTVLRPSAVVALHQYREKDGSNRLRSLFLFFVDIFIGFLCLLFFSIVMVIVTSQQGPLDEIRGFLSSFNSRLPAIVGYTVYVTWGTWYVALILKLKSFVYNLYQALMIGMTESVHSATECANMVNDQQGFLQGRAQQDAIVSGPSESDKIPISPKISKPAAPPIPKT